MHLRHGLFNQHLTRSNKIRFFSAFQVNENGLVSFVTEIPSFFNVEFPLVSAVVNLVKCKKKISKMYFNEQEFASTEKGGAHITCIHNGALL